jgi:hypothetical protein
MKTDIPTHNIFDCPFLEDATALDAFVEQWREGTLEKSAWTHAAHVGVAGYFALDNTAEGVFARMKRGILHLNDRTGVVNGPDSGYHETLTQFWSNIITESVHAARLRSRFEAAAYAVRMFGDKRDLPKRYYSFDVIRDRRARAGWVAPDLDG